MINAQFYFMLSVPLVGILVNVVLMLELCRRLDRLADRVHRMATRIERRLLR